MRSFGNILLIILLFATGCGLVGYHWWEQPGAGTTSIQLTGAPGDSFTGFYVQQGKRIDVRGIVPWKIAEAGISEAEFRKSRADEPLKVQARHFKSHGFDAFVAGTVKPEFAGMRVRVHHAGIGIEPLR